MSLMRLWECLPVVSPHVFYDLEMPGCAVYFHLSVGCLMPSNMADLFG